MGRSHNTGGGRALLFERLVDLEPGRKEEPQPFRVLSREELWESVRRELGQLLNTRCPVPLHLLGEEERTVINYGIPDFTSLSPQSGNDRKLIAHIITQTVTAFETRLRNVRVTVEDYEENERTLRVTLEADLVTETIIEIRSHPEFGSSLEPVTFPIILNRKTGILEV
jgi:type VI secretion system protein ImpF